MFDVYLETIRAAILFALVLFLFQVGRRHIPMLSPSWNLIVGGFVLLLFGSVMDITDEFPELNRFIIIGDTPTQAILEKLVGYLGGIILLAVGLVRWVPRELKQHQMAILALEESEQQIRNRMEDVQDREQRLEEQSRELIAMAEDLSFANDELAKLNNQKDKFFAIIAHDLKSPFNALIGFSEILSKQGETLSGEQVREYGGMVHESANQAYKLLEDLLDWARFQMGKVDFRPTEFEVSDIVQDNVLRFRLVAATKDIKLEGAGDPELKVYADANMLDTILRNLINNAIKFTPNDGNVIVTATNKGESVELAISDNGVGIEEGKVARLFDLDQKVSTIGTDGETGTGLGLKLCKELLDIQGGKIFVDSITGKGSTFRFTLPISS